MEHWINLSWPVDYWQLEKIWDFYEVVGDTIVYNFKINDFPYDLSECAVRGEIYDLNVSNRMANDFGGPYSAPEIIVTKSGPGIVSFTATCAAGLTYTMQPYAQVEFEITTPNGAKFTIMQQPIHFQYDRIIWNNERQDVIESEDEGIGENPLF